MAASAALGVNLWPSAGAAQGTAPHKAREAPMPVVGDLLPLPPAPVTLLDDSSLDPARLRDAVLVLYGWTSWCAFCAVQSPHIDALWRRQRDKGLFVLGLSIDTRAEEARAHLKSKGYGFASV